MIKNIKYIVLIAISVFLISCGAIVKGNALRKLSVEKGTFPSDFGEDKYVLICELTGRNSVDKYMKKHIKRNYTGKYEFVLLADKSYREKYNDKEKYRYVFESQQRTVNNLNGPGYSLFKYRIIDRKEQKAYGNDIYSSYFSKLIKAYVLKMEDSRNNIEK